MRLLNRFVSNVDGTVPPWAVIVKEVEAPRCDGMAWTTFQLATASDPDDKTRVWWLLGSTADQEPQMVGVSYDRDEMETLLLAAILAQAAHVVLAMTGGDLTDANQAVVVYTHPEEVPLP